MVKSVKDSEEKKKFFELLFENLKQKKNKISKFNEKKIAQKKTEYKDGTNNEKIDENNNNSNQLIQFNLDLNNDRKQSIKDCPPKNSISIEHSNRGNDSIIKNNPKSNDIISPVVQNTVQPIDLKRRVRTSLFSKSPVDNGFFTPNKEEQNEKNNQNRNKLFNMLNEIHESKFTYKIIELFPYKYYFCSVFVKNFDIIKFKCWFSKKFAKVYKFVSKIFDVSSYLKLMREFEVLKNTLLNENDVNFIERPRKINVNERLFLRNMNECIEGGNFNIFSSNILK